MQSTRECLKELIDRGNALQNPQYDSRIFHSAWQLANAGPSQTEITTWERDVKAFSYQYLREHPAYSLICNASKMIDSFTIGTVVNYLEKYITIGNFGIHKRKALILLYNLILNIHLYMMCLFLMRVLTR